MQFFRVRNLEKFQHYKDRHPVWIKLYRDLWADQRFTRLSEFERYSLITFFMIASQNQNCIPLDERWLRGELRTSKKPPVDSLVLAGWLEFTEQNASTPLSTRASAPSQEKETYKEETEKKPPNPLAGVFAKVWADYPNPVGKKAAQRHFETSVKTEADVADLTTALGNYRRVREIENQSRREPIPWQNGSTWFNNWRDWITIKPNGNGAQSTTQVEAVPEAVLEAARDKEMRKRREIWDHDASDHTHGEKCQHGKVCAYVEGKRP